MEPTIEQALQQGVAAHREGNLQEAERLYRTVLQSQPAHPDANHNLGVLAVSANKADAALPLFKLALETNPKIEQFWLSYIDALIKEKQFENAKQVLEQGKKQGVAGEKLNALETQLASINQTENVDSASPSQTQLSSLLEHYQNGRYDDAEKMVLLITQEFPEHQFGWKVLGAVLKQTGRVSESLVANQKSVQLAPQDAEAHNNLGNTLRELGRSKDAEASYTQAIALKSDYAEARYNLGVLLWEAKQLEKAAEQFKLSTIGESKYYLLRCLYLQDEKSLFFDQLDYFINQGEIHPMIGSLGCRSALRYGIERPNLYCKNPLKYVLKINLNNQYDFEKVFVKTARTILNENRIPDRRQNLLTNSRQTSGNLFDLERDFTEEIQNIIRSEVERYQVHFKDSEDGLITSWPTNYSLRGWLVSMKSGGKIDPHMHEDGWISGSIYINVPSKSKTESGNFVVCIEEEYLTGENRNQEESIDVVTGSMCLFPASLLHYTIPFESEEKRIVLAFDVVPG